jgi:hypothetical protein
MDFVIVGVTSTAGAYDPKTCLQAELYNPQRALLSPVHLTSNNQHCTDYILRDSPNDDNAVREALLELKASFRARARANAVRTRITYHGFERVALETTTHRLLRPVDDWEESDEDVPPYDDKVNYEDAPGHPLRLSGKAMAHIARGERSSNDSVMSVL